MDRITRCPWVKDSFEEHYHDIEWGVPTHDDLKLFEMLILEGMQAGLSWNIVLKKREFMREAFDKFTPEIIAEYNDNKLEELLQNKNIIRNRRKIYALKKNAKAFLEVQKKFGTFDKYIWQFVQNKTIINEWIEITQVPTKNEISDKMSKQLKKDGFSFVGTTICYSYMQATGMVDDHLTNCSFHSKNRARKIRI